MNMTIESEVKECIKIYKHLQKSAEKRGIFFDLNLEEFVMWYHSQTKNCTYCGVEQNTTPSNLKRHEDEMMEEEYGQPTFFRYERLAIDRKENNRGYEIDNIVLACRSCNAIKHKYKSYNDMMETEYVKNVRMCRQTQREKIEKEKEKLKEINMNRGFTI